MTQFASLEEKIDQLREQLSTRDLRAAPPVLMTTDECATFLQVSPDRLYQWRREGGGPEFCRPTARTVRYHVEDVLAWMKGAGA